MSFPQEWTVYVPDGPFSPRPCIALAGHGRDPIPGYRKIEVIPVGAAEQREANAQVRRLRTDGVCPTCGAEDTGRHR